MSPLVCHFVLLLSPLLSLVYGFYSAARLVLVRLLLKSHSGLLGWSRLRLCALMYKLSGLSED